MSLQDAKIADAPAESTPAPAAAPAAKAPAAAPPPPAKDAPKAPPADPKAAPPTSTPAPDAKAPPAKVSTSTSIFDDDDEDGEPAAAADAPADGKTVEPAADETEKTSEKADELVFPDNWRELIAKGDEKYLAELKRYASPNTWLKSQRALRQKVSSGEYKKTDAWDDSWDDERKAEFRKENGIPEKPTDYALPEVKGKEWTDQDKAALSPFLERLHARNATPAVVQETLAFYAEALTMAAEQKVMRDREDKIALEDELRPEWGTDYRANVNLMKRVLADPEVLPGGDKGLGAALLTARLDDGRRLINVPAMAQFLAGLAREHYGEGGMLPSSEVKEMETRETELLKVMRTDIDRYHREKNAKGQTMAQELAEIRQRKAGGKRAA